jgi:hypothetical protein
MEEKMKEFKGSTNVMIGPLGKPRPFPPFDLFHALHHAELF